MEEMTMGKRIMALRKQKGLTQEQLAERVSVSPQAVSKWENDVSCPDIAIVPRIAEVLGVTTDELLGVKPVEPRVVVVDSGSGEKKGNGSYTFHFDGSKRSGVVFALLVILVGAAFLLSKTQILPTQNLNLWGIVWPAVVLGLGVSWTMSDASPLSVGVSALGLYYLLFNLGAVTYELSWSIIWPVALILLGLGLLIDKLFPNRKKGSWNWSNHGRGEHVPVTDYTDADGFVHYDSSFAEDARKVRADVFSGGNVDISFGKSVLDLTECKTVAPGARLKFDVSFASLEILVPRSIRTMNGADKSFGSITMRGEPSPDATETLQLDGDVSFGNLLIRYI